MPLKKLGEKIKSSLQHLSPKSKKVDEVHHGDLSPCNLPPTAATQQKDPQPFPAEPKACCTPNAPCEGKSPCENPNECQGAEKCADQQRADEVPIITEAASQTATKVEPACGPSATPQPCECPCPMQPSTPRYEETADIFPTMYYALKISSKEPVQQSVLLVNPSKSDKTFSLRLVGDCSADLEKESVSIPGDYVERVTVTLKPEKETEDVYINMLECGHLYDKIRVQAKVL